MFGVVKLSGKHLPFAFLALDLLMNQDIWTDAMGILMGHMWVPAVLWALAAAFKCFADLVLRVVGHVRVCFGAAFGPEHP